MPWRNPSDSSSGAWPEKLQIWRATGDGPAAAGGDAIHVPVLLDEILNFFSPAPGQWILDGTLGFGGHSERFLERGASVIGIDQDADALKRARARLAKFPNFHAFRGNSSEAQALLDDAPESIPRTVDAILFDLGTSSWQLDEAERGFSFQQDGPLDMRMDQRAEKTAADLVNDLPEKELARLLWTYGEERASRAIARAIGRRRQTKPFERTGDLAEVIAGCVRRSGRIHPATRAFQGLRIAVNRELDVLPQMLELAVSRLRPGGKLAVISFHSLEDRVVKRFLRHHSQAWIDDPTWPEPRPNPDHHFDLPNKLIQPTPEECRRNPRARSARLRLAIRR